MVSQVTDVVSKHAAVVVEQGSAALQSAQEDLKEFADTLSSETVEIKEEVKDQIEKVTENLKNKVENKSGDEEEASEGPAFKAISNNIEKVGGFLSSLLQNSEPVSSKSKTSSKRDSSAMTPGEAKLAAMQSSSESYTTNPEDERFSEFLQNFGSKHETEFKKEVLEALNNSDDVRGFFTSIVPEPVPENVFWARYFFRVQVLRQEEQRRKFLLARLNKEKDDKKAEESSPIPKRGDQKKQLEERELQDGEKGSTEIEENVTDNSAEVDEPEPENAVESDSSIKQDTQENPDPSPNSGGKSSQRSGSSGGWVDIKEKKEENTREKQTEAHNADLEGDLDLNAIVDGLGELNEENKEDDECWVWE